MSVRLLSIDLPRLETLSLDLADKSISKRAASVPLQGGEYLTLDSNSKFQRFPTAAFASLAGGGNDYVQSPYLAAFLCLDQNLFPDVFLAGKAAALAKPGVRFKVDNYVKTTAETITPGDVLVLRKDANGRAVLGAQPDASEIGAGNTINCIGVAIAIKEADGWVEALTITPTIVTLSA